MVHGHHDSGTAKSTITRCENRRVACAHIGKISPHPPGIHQAQCVELGTFTLLTDRSDCHAARYVVLAARYCHRRAPAVSAPCTGLGAHALQRKASPGRSDPNWKSVVNELNALLGGLMQFYFPRWNILRAAAVHYFDALTTRQPFSRPAGIHGHIAAANHNHGFWQAWTLTAVDTP